MFFVDCELVPFGLSPLGWAFVAIQAHLRTCTETFYLDIVVGHNMFDSPWKSSLIVAVQKSDDAGLIGKTYPALAIVQMRLSF